MIKPMPTQTKQEAPADLLTKKLGRNAALALKQFWYNSSQRKRLSFVTLAMAIVDHIVSAVIVGAIHADGTIRFASECCALIFVSIGFSIAGFAVRKVAMYRVMHIAQLFTLLGIILLLEGRYANAAILLSVPFVTETALFDENRIAYLVNASFIVLASMAIYYRLHSLGLPALFPYLVTYLLVVISAAGFASVLIYYREMLVEESTRVSNLRATVLNLSNANKAFQLYAGNVESESSERERNRITRELHDLVGYALTNVIVMMNAGRVLLKQNPAELDEVLEKVGNETEQALSETRQILHLLRSVRTHETKGLEAIAQLVKSFQGAIGIEITLNLGNLPWTLGQRLDSAIFRFVQEGITNAFHHGKADRIWVSFWRTDEEIRISIRDNGRGVESEGEIVEGIGISGMRERMAAFGGTIHTRNPVEGFEIQAFIPYRIGDVKHEDQSPNR